MNEHLIRNIFKIIISFITYYSGILPVLLKIFLKKGLYVFSYHGFNTFINSYWKFGSLFYSNYRGNFEKQIQFFNKYMKKIESFDLENNAYDNPTYFLTFDDGYKDNFDLALGILKKYSIPGMFLITTGVIGTNNLLWYDEVRLLYEYKKRKNILSSIRLKKQCKNKLDELKQQGYKEFIKNFEGKQKFQNTNFRMMMDWDEIKKAYNNRIMIGSHTHTHPILTKLNFNQQEKEIESSIEIIKKQLDYVPIFFSYPEGTNDSYNSDTINILKRSGIKYSFTTSNGFNNEQSTPYRLKRIGVNPSDQIPLLALKIIITVIKDILKNNRIRELKYSSRQYGFLNSFIRALKKILKIFGLHFETYYILHRNLNKEIKLFSLPEKIKVKRITYKDFKESEFFYRYPQSKKKLYIERFSNNAYEAFGVKINDTLVYITWIATDYLRIKPIRFERKLKKNEGVLVDSLALPKARRLGIHRFMNGYRLEKLKRRGVKKVYAAVLAENIPALKTQIKHDLRQGEKITWFKFGNLEKYFRKEVNFK